MIIDSRATCGASDSRAERACQSADIDRPSISSVRLFSSTDMILTRCPVSVILSFSLDILPGFEKLIEMTQQCRHQKLPLPKLMPEEHGIQWSETKSLLMTSSSAVILVVYLLVVFSRLGELPPGTLEDTDLLLRFWATATLVFIPVSVVARNVHRRGSAEL